MSSKSGEWFYGAVGALEVKNINQSVIKLLGKKSSKFNFNILFGFFIGGYNWLKRSYSF